jgi:hypothetical protein
VGEHFVGDFEGEVAFPDRLLGGSGEGQAEFAELVDVHWSPAEVGFEVAVEILRASSSDALRMTG